MFNLIFAHFSPQCVNQPKFWLTMYQNFAVNYSKRHLQNNGCVSLPEHFSPEYVNKQCRGNLRIHVVRALFHTYGPLKDRLVSPKNTWRGDPHSIVGMICLSAWTARKSSNYRFCFKLSKKQFINGVRNAEQQPEVTNEWEDLEEDLELPDVGISSEEKCLLLHLDTNAFSFLPGSLIGKHSICIATLSVTQFVLFHKNYRSFRSNCSSAPFCQQKFKKTTDINKFDRKDL